MADLETITWVDPSNNEQILTCQGWIDVSGWTGLDMADFEYVENEIPFDYGSYLKRVKTPPREMDIDVLLFGSSRADLFQKIRNLRILFNSYRGIGKLKVVAPDGEERYIHCVYKQGLEGQTGADNVGSHWRRMTLVFRAFDPFFYGSETTQTFMLNQNPPKWFPIFPLNLGGDAVSSQIEVNNDGDIEAYPIWTIYGPGLNPKMINQTTGAALALNDVGLSSHLTTIMIDTKERQIVDGTGQNLLPQLAWGSTFWTLQPGINQIKIEMAEATAASKIDLAYRYRYLGV